MLFSGEPLEKCRAPSSVAPLVSPRAVLSKPATSPPPPALLASGKPVPALAPRAVTLSGHSSEKAPGPQARDKKLTVTGEQENQIKPQ